MATKCDISKTEAENIINNQEEKDEYFDKKSAVNYILDEGKELQEVLDNEFPKGRFQDESVINKKINDYSVKRIVNEIRRLIISKMILDLVIKTKENIIKIQKSFYSWKLIDKKGKSNKCKLL